tara:strand:+ start:4051 stop:5742 length:1692 start_codon:yes stop_codon:yes gene_type:complete
MSLKEVIRKYALQNAIKFDGKPNVGAVIGKVLSENSDLKSKTKELAKQIQEEIQKIVKLSVQEMKKELKKLAPELLENKKIVKPRELPDLKNATPGKVVIRFEPSPSGPMHIGHAYVMSLNAEYVRKYKGKLILRIADTNPENIYKPAYELLVEDAQWLTNKLVGETLIQSERLEIYYSYMERLLGLDKAYICTCDTEKFRELIGKKKACPCRDAKDHMGRWKKMFDGFEQGEAVARVKTDINDKNPAMRDFPVFRICESKHPKQGTKYRVWPLMNMAVACDDIENNVTHVIRAKDHADNAKRQEFIYDYLGKKAPEAMFVGRINFEGMPVSASKTRIAIDEKKFTGWDDIRLPFLQALSKRGYVPEAFIHYAIDVGMSLNDKSVKKDEFFKTLNAFNKEMIDPIAYRYFFVWNPVKITIKNAPKQNIELDLHPEQKKKGRNIETKQDFFITQDDFDIIEEGKIYRLMDCLNFEKKKNEFVFHSTDYKIFKESDGRIMHYLPAEETLKVEVLMDDNTIKSGVGELSLKSVKKGQVVQLERFGFCRLELKDKKKNELLFWYGHK